jgi:hypothetical protein
MARWPRSCATAPKARSCRRSTAQGRCRHGSRDRRADRRGHAGNMREAAADARRVRRRVGLSQAALARRIGVPVDTVRDWEQARHAPHGPPGHCCGSSTVRPRPCSPCSTVTPPEAQFRNAVGASDSTLLAHRCDGRWRSIAVNRERWRSIGSDGGRRRRSSKRGESQLTCHAQK